MDRELVAAGGASSVPDGDLCSSATSETCAAGVHLEHRLGEPTLSATNVCNPARFAQSAEAFGHSTYGHCAQVRGFTPAVSAVPTTTENDHVR